MSMLDQWHNAGNLPKAEQEKIWAEMSGTEKVIAWREYNERQEQEKQQAIQTTKSESDKLFENVMNGCDPNSEIGKAIIAMRDHGRFDVYRETKTVDEYGGVIIRKEKI